MNARTIHPFPARMAPDIAIDRLSSPSAGHRLQVLDPMCGSGTVLTSAVAHGHHAQGFDMDPLAVLMSRVATQAVDLESVRSCAEYVVEKSRSSALSAPRWNDAETIRFAEYWFAKDQRIQLTRLSVEIEGIEDSSTRQALEVALSRIIVTKSPKASLAADTSHSRPHRVIDSSDFDVYKGFLTRRLEVRAIVGCATVSRGDARSMEIASNSVDLVITSPPYLNAIDYLRGHRLALIWLGHTIPELRKIRSDSIGAERALGSSPLAAVVEMVALIEDSVTDAEKLPKSIITRYAQDLAVFAHEIYRVVRPGAKVVTVIGNSTLRGNYIQNDLLVRRAYEFAGFRITSRTERDLPENRRYMPVRASHGQSPIDKRMRTEVIVDAEKCA